MGLRVVVTCATGNLGSTVLSVLDRDDRIERNVGVARRTPDWRPRKISWVPVDSAQVQLDGSLADADTFVHLAWLIQPSRDAASLWDVNAHGSRLILEQAAASGVGTTSSTSRP